MGRRRCLGAAAALALALPSWRGATAASRRLGPQIIDTHTHFYDPARPEGIAWPERTSQLFRRAMPDDYERLARPLRVAGVIVVEAVWRPEDHDWIFRVGDRHPLVLGVIGQMSRLLGTPAFADRLRHYGRSPLFRGIRIGEREVKRALRDDDVLVDLRRLAERGLVVDINPHPGMLSDIAALARRAPDLRIVIEHFANLRIDGAPPPERWTAGMQEAAAQPNVLCKVSYLVEGSVVRRGGRAPTSVDHYRPVLDVVWQAFGENRLLFGSNWPVSEPAAGLHDIVGIVESYFAGKGPAAVEKHFWRNARAVYGGRTTRG